MRVGADVAFSFNKDNRLLICDIVKFNKFITMPLQEKIKIQIYEIKIERNPSIYNMN